MHQIKMPIHSEFIRPTTNTSWHWTIHSLLEILNSEVLETLLVPNGLSKVLKNCVYNRRRRALELAINADILRRFCLFSHPSNDRVCGVLCEALVHLHLVQPDLASYDVLGALRDDFSLVR